MNSGYFKNALDAFYFRFLILIVGFILLPFYGVLFVGAIINLPVSWMGVLYSGFGLAAAISCFVYFKKKERKLLVLILFAFIAMLVTFLQPA